MTCVVTIRYLLFMKLTLQILPFLKLSCLVVRLHHCNTCRSFGFSACLFSGRWYIESRWKVNILVDTQNNLNPTGEWRYVFVKFITNGLYFNSVYFEHENSSAVFYCSQTTGRKEYFCAVHDGLTFRNLAPYK